MRTEAHDSVGHGGAEAGGLQRRSSSSIGLVWGVGKQRAGTLCKSRRTKEVTQRHLRRGWAVSPVNCLCITDMDYDALGAYTDIATRKRRRRQTKSTRTLRRGVGCARDGGG